MAEHRLVRRSAVAVAALVLTSAGAVVGSADAGAASAWAPTATKALSLVNATALGPAAASQPLRITVGLTPQNRSGLDTLIKQQATPGSANYESYLSPAQFAARFAPSAATASAVQSYLTSQGLTNVTVAANRLQVTADATVASAQKAFHTTIGRFLQSGRTVLANTAAAQVPSSLAGSVSGVLGLSTLGASAGPALSVPKLTGYYPKEFNTVYDSGNTTPGTNSTLAVIAEGDLTSTVQDLRTAEAKQGLPQVPVSLVYSGVKSTDVSGADEWDLDTQTSTGVAPNAKRLYIYVATSLTDSDLARAINQFAAQDVAKSGSASLGECDVLPYLDGSMTVDDIAFAEAAVQGQTFFASSGDTGSACAVAPTNGVPGAGAPDVEYPASSPYVLGVGGTTLRHHVDRRVPDRDRLERRWRRHLPGGDQPVLAERCRADGRPRACGAFRTWPSTPTRTPAPRSTSAERRSRSAEPAWPRRSRWVCGRGCSPATATRSASRRRSCTGCTPRPRASSPLPPSAVPGFHDIVAGRQRRVHGAARATTTRPAWAAGTSRR